MPATLYLLVLVDIETCEHLNGQVLVHLGLHFTQVTVPVHFHVPTTTTAQDVLAFHAQGRLGVKEGGREDRAGRARAGQTEIQ